MFKNVLIIGCGLIGSSLLRGIVKKKLTKHIYIFEKLKNINSGKIIVGYAKNEKKVILNSKQY